MKRETSRQIPILASVSIGVLLFLVILILLDCYNINAPVLGLSVPVWSVLFGAHAIFQTLIGILILVHYPLNGHESGNSRGERRDGIIYNSEMMRIFVAYVLGGTLLFTLFIFVPVSATYSENIFRVRDYLVIFFSWSLPAFAIYGLYIKSWWKLYS